MSSNKEAIKIPLTKNTHSVRAAQAVLQFGVGNYVDFPDQTLMTAAPEYWETQVKKIADQRLANALKVEYFGMPSTHDNDGKDLMNGISYVRFPEWYFCPKCRKFQPISQWVREFKTISSKYSETDPYMTKNMKCPTCRQDLIITRIVTACRNGHIDDFPWVKWVHCQNMYGKKHVCDHPKLYLKMGSTSSEGLESINIICENCNATASLRNAFTPGYLEELDRITNGEFDFRCSGRHPWKNSKEPCGEYPVVLQRGSSSVYFPVTASSLVIPPYSSILLNKVETSNGYEDCRKNIIGALKTLNNLGIPVTEELQNRVKTEKIEEATGKISIETGIKRDSVKEVLTKKWFSQESETCDAGSIQFRAEEYEALTGRVKLKLDEYGSDFVREETDLEKYGLPYLKQITLVHKIREVRALLGYSRLKPVDETESPDKQTRFVCIKNPETEWYPAYEVRGEGIFIEFDNTSIEKWISLNPIVKSRTELLTDNYRNSFSGSKSTRIITPKFVLLHTIAHLLMKQLSFECGYNIASIRERLYCSEQSEGTGMAMAGILLYTASGDSEGTLGGLVRQGCADTFPVIFKKAIESALSCSNDPVCSLSSGQGRDSLNLAACYSCCLVPETSCEEFNSFLDRGMLIGTLDDDNFGFYSELVKKNWELVVDTSTEKKEDTSATNIIINPKSGSDLSDTDYASIWDDILQWSDDVQEIALLESINHNLDQFNNKEKPRKNVQIISKGRSLTCDLLWEKSKLIYFTAENSTDIEYLKDSDWMCIAGNEQNLTCDEILQLIKEI